MSYNKLHCHLLFIFITRPQLLEKQQKYQKIDYSKIDFLCLYFMG